MQKRRDDKRVAHLGLIVQLRWFANEREEKSVAHLGLISQLCRYANKREENRAILGLDSAIVPVCKQKRREEKWHT